MHPQSVGGGGGTPASVPQLCCSPIQGPHAPNSPAPAEQTCSPSWHAPTLRSATGPVQQAEVSVVWQAQPSFLNRGFVAQSSLVGVVLLALPGAVLPAAPGAGVVPPSPRAELPPAAGCPAGFDPACVALGAGVSAAVLPLSCGEALQPASPLSSPNPNTTVGTLPVHLFIPPSVAATAQFGAGRHESFCKGELSHVSLGGFSAGARRRVWSRTRPTGAPRLARPHGA
jgi:hypothetical protein